MEYTKIQGLDKKVSRIFMGTWLMFPDEMEKHFEKLDAAFEAGITAFDGARAYESEPTIGEWIQRRGNREDIVLLSKGGHPTDERKRITDKDIKEDMELSLKELQTDYVDIYLLHRDDEELPVGPIVEILNELKAAGKVKVFGGSNWTHKRLEEANEYAYKHNLESMLISSPHYSLAEQVKNPFAPGCVTVTGANNGEARAWYANNQMPLLAYSSLGRGFFSGRVTKELFENDPESVDMFCRLGYCYDINFKRLERVKEIAAYTGYEIPQIALSYILNSDMNVYPVIGAFNKEEINCSVKSLDIKLTEKEMAYLALDADTL